MLKNVYTVIWLKGVFIVWMVIILIRSPVMCQTVFRENRPLNSDVSEWWNLLRDRHYWDRDKR